MFGKRILTLLKECIPTAEYAMFETKLALKLLPKTLAAGKVSEADIHEAIKVSVENLDIDFSKLGQIYLKQILTNVPLKRKLVKSGKQVSLQPTPNGKTANRVVSTSSPPSSDVLSRKNRSKLKVWMLQEAKHPGYKCPSKGSECATCQRLFRTIPVTKCHQGHSHGPVSWYPHVSRTDLKLYHEGLRPDKEPIGQKNPLLPKTVSASVQMEISEAAEFAVPVSVASSSLPKKRRVDDDARSIVSVRTHLDEVKTFPSMKVLGLSLKDKIWSTDDAHAFKERVQKCQQHPSGVIQKEEWAKLLQKLPPHCSITVRDAILALSERGFLPVSK